MHSAPVRMLWRSELAGDDGVGGHAYLVVSETDATFLHLVHSPRTTPAMVVLLAEWEAMHPAADEIEQLRLLTTWRPPGELDWSFSVDAGRLETLLEGRSVHHVQLEGPEQSELLTRMPVEFLRAPVATWVRAQLGEVTILPSWNAATLRPYFQSARSGESLAFSGCRYGSASSSPGQDRTAAVWLSEDGGQSFEELPWVLPQAQRGSPGAALSFPPEQIDRLAFEPTAGGQALRVEWEDPWIAYEEGSAWTAEWQPGAEQWVLSERAGLWSL